MTERKWEVELALTFPNRGWDESTELASMIADECFPKILADDFVRESAARIVISLFTDGDWRNCVEALLDVPVDLRTPASTEDDE